MGIEEQAINNLIVKALMLNYAYDLGLRVSKEEIIQEITSIEGFQNKGKFDEQIYKQTLKDNQLKPKDFEEGIEEGLLLQKLDALLNIPLTPLEIEALGAAYSMEDLVHIEVINKKDIVFTPKEEEIKKYWENNKDIPLPRAYFLMKTRMHIEFHQLQIESYNYFFVRSLPVYEVLAEFLVQVDG